MEFLDFIKMFSCKIRCASFVKLELIIRITSLDIKIIYFIQKKHLIFIQFYIR